MTSEPLQTVLERIVTNYTDGLRAGDGN